MGGGVGDPEPIVGLVFAFCLIALLVVLGIKALLALVVMVLT